MIAICIVVIALAYLFSHNKSIVSNIANYSQFSHTTVTYTICQVIATQWLNFTTGLQVAYDTYTSTWSVFQTDDQTLSYISSIVYYSHNS